MPVSVPPPQAKGDPRNKGAGAGCWNWMSYDDDPLFDTRQGYEIGMVANLVNDLQNAVDQATSAASPPEEVMEGEGE